MTTVPRTAALFAALGLAACSAPFEGRVATLLHDAGLSRPMADCMAERWVDRLSVLQLRKIQRLTGEISRENRRGTLTVVAFVERVRRVNDPEIFRVVSSSAAICALKTG